MKLLALGIVVGLGANRPVLWRPRGTGMSGPRSSGTEVFTQFQKRGMGRALEFEKIEDKAGPCYKTAWTTRRSQYAGTPTSPG